MIMLWFKFEVIDLDHFVFDLIIFIIINDYGNVGVDLDERKTDFSGGLCQEKIIIWAVML